MIGICKNRILILLLPAAILLSSCRNELENEGFYPEKQLTIADYLEVQKDSLPTFYTLLDELGFLSSLSAYNPNGNNYTLFLPSEDAFADFFSNNPEYSTLDKLLADNDYASTLALYHIVNTGLLTTDFPFGSLPDTTASGAYLTVAIDTASSLPKINGVAQILIPNIELINGNIHVIDKVLKPITFHIGEWLSEQDRLSILYDALELTGLIDSLNSSRQYTLLAESNQVFNKQDIFSVEDLIAKYSPDNIDFSSEDNGLYRFAAFHLLNGIYYLDDFEGSSALYNTSTIYPVIIDGESLVIKINQGVGNLDTLIHGSDTTIIDYIGFNYESSNNQTLNGAVHLIDNIMELFLPERIQVVNQFYNDPAINDIKNNPAETVFTNPADFTFISWSGVEELIYVKSSEVITGVWNNDYIILDGIFTFSYEIPKLLPGKYKLYVAAHAFDDRNASIRISFDGNDIGGNIDLTSGGISNNPYFNFLVGTLDIDEYSSHVIEVVSLIPGIFKCDRFTLEPVD